MQIWRSRRTRRRSMWVCGLTSREAITPADYPAEGAHQIDEKVEYKVFARDQFDPRRNFSRSASRQ